jgi:hypothetical protein
MEDTNAHNRIHGHGGIFMRKEILIALVIVASSVNSIQAEDQSAPTMMNLSSARLKGEPPSPGKIESAYIECLKQMDEELGSLGGNSSIRRAAIDSQSAICRKSKSDCILNPKSTDCRGFVEDYAQ